ncbi:PEPxxWA-CTERM sorting domain-containing protein [Polymorphobacter arshaanensis]|nr:PEPxxWA-CTERM sorting domain-containing protein [Polymorphobacter arshaanensis]
MKTRIALALLAATSIATTAQASITVIGSQAAFSAEGPIAQNTNWDSYTGFTTPGNNFTVGALTFVEGGQNLIGGNPDYGMARSLFTDNYILGTTINIAGTYDLFAFNLGNFLSAGGTTVAITTNLNTYSFNPATLSYANNGTLTFAGYKASAGEYFTSVNYSGPEATGATDIQLGNAVPEPASWALMIVGFGMVGATLRRRAAVAA